MEVKQVAREELFKTNTSPKTGKLLPNRASHTQQKPHPVLWLSSGSDCTWDGEDKYHEAGWFLQAARQYWKMFCKGHRSLFHYLLCDNLCTPHCPPEILEFQLFLLLIT